MALIERNTHSQSVLNAFGGIDRAEKALLR
jgi:hypothetical protein